MVIGVLLVGVAAALGAWRSNRLVAANPTSRLSLGGSPPPHQPTGNWYLITAMVGSVTLGSLLIGDASHHQSWVFLAFLLAAVAVLVPVIIHNRKVARTINLMDR